MLKHSGSRSNPDPTLSRPKLKFPIPIPPGHDLIRNFQSQSRTIPTWDRDVPIPARDPDPVLEQYLKHYRFRNTNQETSTFFIRNIFGKYIPTRDPE